MGYSTQEFKEQVEALGRAYNVTVNPNDPYWQEAHILQEQPSEAFFERYPEFKGRQTMSGYLVE